MTLARYQFTVTDAAGNTIPGASIEVRAETVGAPLAVLHSDRAGATPIGNPFYADMDGFVSFHTVGGAYKITATSGSFSREWRYVAIGLAQETDALTTGIRYLFDTGTTDADPGTGYLRFNAGKTALYINDNDVSAWLDSWDDQNGGIVTIMSADGSTLFIGRVSGSIVNATTYRKVTVTAISTIGTFIAGQALSIMFTSIGNGDVNGPASSVSGNFASFNDMGGKTIQDSGSKAADFAVATVGQGKQLLAWVPAGAMVPNTTNGPAFVTTERATNKNMVKTLAFDATTSESAQFSVAMPKKWNESTLTFVPYWSHDATTTNFGVVWALSGVAISDNEATDVAFGTAQNSADTGGTTNRLYTGPESSAITIGGTPAELDLVNFKIARLPADGSDTMAIDAKLIGVKVFYTINAVTEA